MKDNNIKVSVIIPVYNVEKYLRECLDSVKGQTLKDIEIICIDDHSPDNCPQILDEYASGDDRFKIIHLSENHQQGYARNRGMEVASGEYIYLLDSDDLIAVDAMERLYDEAEKYELDGLIFDSQVFYDDEKLKKKYGSYPAHRTGKYEDRVYTGMELFSAFMSQMEWNCYIQRQFWKREYLSREDIRFPEGVEHEDEVFSFEAIIASERVMYRDYDFYIRRVRENSVVTSPPAPKNFYGYFMDYGYMVEAAAKRGLHSDAIDANLGRIYAHLMDYYDKMADHEDLAAWFHTRESLERFKLFEASRNGRKYYDSLAGNAALKIQEETPEEVYIYGAGVIARNVWQGLTRQGFIIGGFLVTESRDNPKALFGRPVLQADTFKTDKNVLIIIAVTKGYQKEIASFLDKKGLKHITFD